MTQTGSVSCVRDEAVAAGRMARWLLLACTLLGLAAMHTLGHAAMSMPQHSSHGRSVAVRSGVCPQELVAVNRQAPGGVPQRQPGTTPNRRSTSRLDSTDQGGQRGPGIGGSVAACAW
jgi:hypothetical protein